MDKDPKSYMNYMAILLSCDDLSVSPLFLSLTPASFSNLMLQMFESNGISPSLWRLKRSPTCSLNGVSQPKHIQQMKEKGERTNLKTRAPGNVCDGNQERSQRMQSEKNLTIPTLLVGRKLTQVRSALIHTLNRALCGFTHTIAQDLSASEYRVCEYTAHIRSEALQEHNEASGNAALTNMQKHTLDWPTLLSHSLDKIVEETLFTHSQSLTEIEAHASFFHAHIPGGEKMWQ